MFYAKVLDVLTQVPREQFVAAGFEPPAFIDTEIRLDIGQFMMTPTLEDRVLQALEYEMLVNVFKIGTGSEFLTAAPLF